MDSNYKFSDYAEINEKRFINARDIYGRRVNIRNADRTHKTAYYCEICKSPVSARFFTDRVSHFAHKTDKCNADIIRECKNKNKIEPHDMSEWHRNKQGMFPIEYTEVYFKGGRRADVFIPQKKTVIEFQHSALKPSIFWARNKYYNSLGLKVIWQYDVSNLISSGRMIYVNPSLYDDIDKTFVSCCEYFVYKIDRSVYEKMFKSDIMFDPFSNDNVSLTFEHPYDYKGNTQMFRKKIVKQRLGSDGFYYLYTSNYYNEIERYEKIAKSEEFPSGAPDEKRLSNDRKQQLKMFEDVAMRVLEQKKQFLISGQLISVKLFDREDNCFKLDSGESIRLSFNIAEITEDDKNDLYDNELNLVSFDTKNIDNAIIDYSIAEDKIEKMLQEGKSVRVVYKYVHDCELKDKIPKNKNGSYICPKFDSLVEEYEIDMCHDCEGCVSEYYSDEVICMYRMLDIYRTVRGSLKGRIRKLRRRNGIIHSVEIFDGNWQKWEAEADEKLSPIDVYYLKDVEERKQKSNSSKYAKCEQSYGNSQTSKTTNFETLFGAVGWQSKTDKNNNEDIEEREAKTNVEKIVFTCIYCCKQKELSDFSAYNMNGEGCICTNCMNNNPQVEKDQIKRLFGTKND